MATWRFKFSQDIYFKEINFLKKNVSSSIIILVLLKWLKPLK